MGFLIFIEAIPSQQRTYHVICLSQVRVLPISARIQNLFQKRIDGIFTFVVFLRKACDDRKIVTAAQVFDQVCAKSLFSTLSLNWRRYSQI